MFGRERESLNCVSRAAAIGATRVCANAGSVPSYSSLLAGAPVRATWLKEFRQIRASKLVRHGGRWRNCSIITERVFFLPRFRSRAD